MSKRRLSLITLHAVQNYGSVLQTVATVRLFEHLGCEVQVVDFVRESNLPENVISSALRRSSFWNADPFRRLAFYVLRAGVIEKRCYICSNFLCKNVILTPHRYLSEADFSNFPISADVYCTGSDQTWNSYWNKGILRPFFLTFAPEGAKKVSYGTSFGGVTPSDDEGREIASLLSSYSEVTVREESARDFLSTVGINSERVLDPVLMLTAEQWHRYVAENCPVKGRYLLLYALGHSPELETAARRAAKERGLCLVRIGAGSEARFLSGKAVINPTPEEFLTLMMNADCVMTDSFHAVCFALTFGVEFFVSPPKLFPGRITELLALFGLESRILGEICREKIDFNRVKDILHRERTRSLKIARRLIV